MVVEYNHLLFNCLGHATVRIQNDQGVTIYFDPWSNVIKNEPNDADLIFVTHDDRDHFDLNAIKSVSKDTTILAYYEKIEINESSYSTVPLAYDSQTDILDFNVKTVPAYNLRSGSHTRQDGDPYHAIGEVIGIVLTMENTDIFFTSDTDLLDVHYEITADVLILPIGGSYTMDENEAIEMVECIDPKLVLPIHYNTDEVPGTEADGEYFKKQLTGTDVELFW